MSASSTEGIVGSIVLVAIFWVAYLIVTKKAAPAAVGGVVTTVPPRTYRDRAVEWLMKYWWSIPLVFVGGAVVWGLSSTPGTPSGSGMWSWSPSLSKFTAVMQGHWLPIIVLVGVVSLLILFFAKETYKATLQKALWWTTAVTFLGFPAWFGVRDAVLPSPICPNGSANEIRSCKVSTAWSYWLEPEAGTPNGMLLCFDGPVEPDSAVINDRSVYRYRAYEGIAIVRYKFKGQCGGPL